MLDLYSIVLNLSKSSMMFSVFSRLGPSGWLTEGSPELVVPFYVVVRIPKRGCPELYLEVSSSSSTVNISKAIIKEQNFCEMKTGFQKSHLSDGF